MPRPAPTTPATTPRQTIRRVRRLAHAAVWGLAAALAACGGGQPGSETNASPQAATKRAQAATSSLPVRLSEAPDPLLSGLTIPTDAATRGMWSVVHRWPMNAIHVALLPNGRVLSYGASVNSGDQNGRTFDTWDPAVGMVDAAHQTTQDNSRNDSFCSTANFLDDGRLLVSGGNTSRGALLYSHGPQTTVNDGFRLADDRWYASTIKLPDGRIVMLGGIDPYTEGQQNNPDAAVQNGQASMTPEVYTAGQGWRSLSGATSREAFGPDYLRAAYPHAWVAPNGQVFGISAETMWSLDVAGNGGLGQIRILGKFKGPPNNTNPVNNGATSGAVMFAPGRILVAGGNGSFNGDNLAGSRLATVVDINGAVPVLTETAPMQYPRRYNQANVLPNGQVLVTGGTLRNNDGGANAVYAAELWNPTTGTWSTAASAAVVRVYHSNSVLLPNGTLLSVGGGAPGPVLNTNAEVYYPPYLFTTVGGRAQLATRPVMTGLSALAYAHGAAGTAEMKTSAAVARLVLIGNGVATHNFNNTQRRLELAFSQAGDRLNFTLPASASLAPPGHYQLIALDAAGVPSVGTIIAVGAGVAAPPTPPSGTGTGLLGSYHNNLDLSGTPVLQRTSAVAFDWGTTAPAPGVAADNFSVRWSGELEAVETGEYQLRTRSDDGVRLYVDGRLLIDDWRAHPATDNTTGSITLTAGQRVPVVLEYMDSGGDAMVRLSWLRPGGAWGGVPASQLYPLPYTVPPGQPEAGATACAAQGQACTLAIGQIGTVWFGAGTAWVRRTEVSGSVDCSTAAFGSDPAPGAAKSCRVLVTDFVRPADGALACATENQTCTLPAGTVATVWFGADNRWAARTAQSGSLACTAALFGNAAPGAVRSCRYQVTGLTDIGPIVAPPVQVGSLARWAPGLAAPGLSFAWQFGDDSVPTDFDSRSEASHVYTRPGLFTVTLTAQSDSGVSLSRSFFQAVYPAPTAQAARMSSPLLLEPRSGAAQRLWVVNPDNRSVSVIDTATQVRLAEIPVGTGPRSLARAPDGRIWVANRDSASLSVIDPLGLTVARTIAQPAASQPQGLVIAADGTVYVALEARGEVRKLSSTGAAVRGIAVSTPRHLALTADGQRLLVSRFITAPAAGESTAVVKASAGAGEVLVVDTATMTRQTTVLLRQSTRTDGENQGSGLPNYLGAAAISPDGTQAWVPSKQDNIRRGRLRSGQDLDFQNTVRAVSSRINLVTLSENPDRRADHDNAGVASAAAYDATGSYLFVALETSRQVEVLDARAGLPLTRVDVGIAPQGLVVSADNSRLYVHNLMDRSVSVIDITPLTRFGELRANLAATVATVGTDLLPPTVLRGKRLFYDARDPRLARDSYLSCASCHADGGHDGRTWDLTGFGEGLRNTPSLRGRGGMAQGFAHWSANFDEVQDFEAQIRSLAGGTGLMSDAQFNTGTRSLPLGDRKAGLSADLDALAAYLGSLDSVGPSPRRNTDRSLTAPAQLGRAVFAAAGCANCHGGVGYTSSGGADRLKNIGTLKASSGKRLNATLTGIDVPTLRDVWATAPYLHDGSAATLAAAVQAHRGNAVAGADLTNLVAYLQQIGSEEATAPTPPPVFGTGSGLLGNYFANNNLLGTAALVRTEAVDFDWGVGTAAGGLPADNFSVRWSGDLQAVEAGEYSLRTRSDDGVRLWVDGVLRIDNWTLHAPTVDTTAPIYLGAGQRVAIVLEYQERAGGAVMQLGWLRPGGAWAPVPVTQLYPGNPPVLAARPPATALRCAAERQTCALPAGPPATVWYGVNDRWVARPGLSGNVACNNENFGDPAPGLAKACLYAR